MSDSVVISKELRDRLLGYSPYMYQGDIDALRDAPETVNLASVDLMERWRLFLLSDPVGTEWWQMHQDILGKLAHLTTTQTHVQGGSVPKVDELQEIIEPIIAKRIEHISEQDVDCPVCFSALEVAQGIHALLLTRRMEGK